MQQPLKLLLKIALTWLLLSLAGLMWGSHLIRLCLPASQWLIDQSPYQFQSQLRLNSNNDGEIIELISVAKHEIPLLPNMAVPASTQISSSISILHAIAPAVVLCTLALCLPVQHWKGRARLMLIGLLVAATVMIGSMPALLIGKTQMYIQTVIEAAKLSRPEPLVVRWTLFWEVGGIWLVPLLFVIGATAAWRVRLNRTTTCNRHSALH